MKRRLLLTFAVLFALGQNLKAQCIQSTPYTENFDGSSWQGPSSWNNSGSIPSCWTRNITTANYLWMASDPSFANTLSGPDGDHTTGTGGYAFAEGWSSGASSNAVVTNLITPPIDLSGDTLPRLVFYYHMYGSDVEWLNIRVRVVGTNTWVNLHTINSTTASSQFSSQTSPWRKHTESLSQFAGDTVQIRFNAKRDVNFSWWTNSRIAIDDIAVEETPSCDQPLNPVASSVTSSSASISWSSLNSNTLGSQIQYATGTTAIANGTINTYSSNPATMSGLNSNTTYRIRVREICAVGDTSVWSNLGTFTTGCSNYIAPYTEDFEGSGWGPSTTWNVQGDIDQCWITQGAAQKFWTVGPPAFSWTQTGPSGDHTSGSGQYAFHQKTSTLATGIDPRLISPWIDLDTLSSPELSFWYHGYGQQMGDLDVYVQKQGGTWSSLWDTSGLTHSSSSAAWLEHIADLSSYAGDTIRVRFDYSASSGSFYTQFAIDDIKIDNAPSCAKPKNTAVTAVGVYVAQLDWVGGGASNWQIRYRAVGTSAWSWTTSSTSNKGVPQLNAQTTYEWQVRDSCGTGDVSLWVDGPDFTTNCSFFTAPFTENFSNSNKWQTVDFTNTTGSVDPCWLRSDTEDLFWVGGNSTTSHYSGTGPSGDHTTGSGGYAFTRSSSPWTATTDTELRTPLIDLDTLQSPELTFWYHMFGPDIDKLRIFVKKPGTPAVLVNTITGQQQSSSTASWQKRTVSLLAYEGDTVQIIFKAYRDGSGFFSYRADIAIDDVKIDETATCPAPNVLASNITYNSAELNWLGRANTSAVEYGPTGFTQGNGTMVGAQNQNAVLTGLQSSTTYDAYVQDTCTSTLTSTWTLVQFTTLACPAISATGSIQGAGASIGGYSTTADADSTVWFWGDGNSSTGDTTNYSYTSFGLFDIYQVVYNSCGNVDSLLHTYSYCDTTIADYTYSINGLSVNFDASTSSGTALDYYWQFGDGGTASTATPSHVYTASGTYTITLLLVNSCGDSTTTTFDLTLCPLVTLGFTSTVTGSTFSFTATPAGLLNYQWSFGDGNTASGMTASNTYSTQGSFTVTVTAEDSCGNQFTYSDDVATCDVPAGDFTFNIVSTSANGMVVNFAANATGADEYHWYWGDGTNDKGTASNIQHTYGVITTNYIVNLFLINECGDSTMVTHRLNEVGIGEQALPIALYPNPLSTFLDVDLPAGAETLLDIYNAQGQLVRFQVPIDATNHRVDMSTLSPGSYVVRVLWENRPYYFSITKI